MPCRSRRAPAGPSIGWRDFLAGFFIGKAEEIAREGSTFAGRLHDDVAFKRQARRPARHRDICRRYRSSPAVSGPISLASVLSSMSVRSGTKSSTRKLLVAIASALRIGIDVHRPGAAHGVFLHRQIDRIAAEIARLADDAAVFHTIRARGR